MMSTVTAVEAGTVMLGRNGWRSLAELKALIVVLDIVSVAFDVGHARFAADTFRLFGRGGHPTSLNLRDYFSYGLARAMGEQWLFKGEDFARTDITRATYPWSPSQTPPAPKPAVPVQSKLSTTTPRMHTPTPPAPN